MDATADHGPRELAPETLRLENHAGSLPIVALALGVLGLVGAVGLGAARNDGWANFLHSYLVSAWYYLSQSVAQDQDRDAIHTYRMQWWSAPGVVIFAFSYNFCGIDFLMSLDYKWFSTIYGVYLFAGAFGAFFSVTALIVASAQKVGL